VVDAPDLRGREGILKVHAAQQAAGRRRERDVAGAGTPGMAVPICEPRERGRAARGSQGHDKIYMSDLEEAKDASCWAPSASRS
jgi:cell division protease FtsH